VSKNKRDLTGEEKKLWRRVAASVKTRKPLPADDVEEEPARAAPPPKPSKTSVVQTVPPRRPAPPAPPQNRGGEKRVRRGKLEIGATLDLHGHTQDSAVTALSRFLRAAQARGDTTVIVVTGMGRGGEGVLKRRLPDWLAAPEIRSIVGGYAPAHRAHGGGGAFYVFIKRPH